jgi:O-antigen/teichoic acid export membrane protein
MAQTSAPADPPRSLLWAGLEALTLAAVSFVVLAALARSLDPETFGRAATALALVQIACSIVEALFHDALVQRRGLEGAQRAAAHTLSVLLAVLVSAGIVAWGLPAGGALSLTQVGSIAALMAPSVVLTGLTAVPLAMLRRRLAMRETALLLGVARVVSAAIAIALLAGGAGVWGLVAHQNLSALVLVLALAWRGHAPLRGWGAMGPARALWRFAAPNSLHGVLTSNRARLFQLLSATVMPARMVGELALALRLVEMLAAVIVTGVARAALVRLSTQRHEGQALTDEFLALTRRFAALATPAFMLVAVLALPLVQVVGDRAWADAAGLVAAFAIAQALRCPVHLSSTLFAAHGRPQLNLLMIGVELTALALLTLLLRDPLAWVWRLAVMLPLVLWVQQRLFDVPAAAVLRAVAHTALAATAAGLLLASLTSALSSWPPLLVLVVAGAAGAALYAALLSLTWRGMWQDLRALAHL